MRLSRRLRVERGDDALSPSKLVAMGWLYRRGGMTAAEIATVERIRPQSLTRLVATLEAEGLIRRRPGESDRREVILELTEAGRAALEEDMRQRDSWLMRAMAKALSPTEQSMLLLAGQLMDRLAETAIEDTAVEDTDEGESEW